MNYYDEFDNNFYYRRKKPKKHIGKFILGLFIGIFSIVGIGAGLFYGIPSIKANMANKLVNDASIYNEAVSENETLKTNNQTLQEDNQNKDTEIENLNNDKVELNDIIENLSQENDDLSSGNRDLRTQNRDLIQQLSLIQASNNCQITLESQTLALTPDGGGFVWLHSNNTNFGTYYLDDSNVYKSSLISNLINETFDHFNFSHYYRIRVPELGLDT